MNKKINKIIKNGIKLFASKKKVWILPAPVILILAAVALGGVGFVAALNGWFGGGSAIPSDTFTRGLVGYWPFEEGSGITAHDASNYGNNGILTAGPLWTKGKVGSALSFDGTDDYVDAGSNASIRFDNTTNFSWSFWIKPNNITGYQSILSEYSSTNYKFFGLDQAVSGGIRFDYGGSADVTAAIVTANVWQHLVLTHIANTTNYLVYVNGELKDTLVSTGSGVNTANKLIGISTTSQFPFNGLIDEVHMYNRTLSAQEVSYHYNRGGPVAQWKFDEGNGVKVYDSTDNKNGAIRSSALNFDGVNDYVAIPDSNDWNFGSGDFTIETWAKFRSVAGTQNFVSQWGDSGSNGSFAFVLDAGATLMFFWSTTGSSELRVDGAWSPSINTWYYVTAIRSGTSIKTYVDTVEKGSGTLSGTIYNSTRNLDIGAYRDAGQIFNGLIDDVRIYNRALSVTEIQEHYKGKYAAETGLMLNVPFNNEAGYTVTDYSGRGNNGTASSTFADMTAGYGDANNTGWAIDTSWQAGKYGQALKFGGTNGFFQTDNSVTSTSAFSYSLWFKSDKGSYAANQYLFSQGDDDPSVYIGTNGKLNVMTDNALKITSSKTVLDTNWHHVQVTADGSQLKLYLDGGFEGSTGYTGSSDDAGFTAGAHIYRTNFFNGYIDDVKIYNYARTPDEIRLDYNAGFAALFGPQTGCDQDPGSCMTQGLAGYWPMEEGSGSVTHDSSNYGKNGTLKYMATSTDAWTKGKVGGGLSFDGTNDYVTVGTDAGMPLGSANRTITGWFKTNVAGAGNQIVGYGTFAQGQYFLVQVTSNNLGVGTHTNNYTGTKTLSLNTWYHFAVLIDGANVKTFINGVADINTAHTNLNTVSGGKFYIGAEPGQGDPAATVWNGVLDEIRIYNRALSVAEIRYHYNRGNPVAQWKFDEGNGTKVYDLTGNNNNGAIRSSALNFNGTSDIVSFPGVLNTAGTAEVRVKWLRNAVGYGTQGLFANFIYQHNGNNYLYTFTWSSAYSYFGYTIPLNTWTHLVFTWTDSSDNSTLKLYADNVLYGPTAGAGGYGSIAGLSGLSNGGAWGNAYFNAIVDEVRVYNRALSAAEVAEHYKGKFSNETGLVLYLPFNDEAGTVAKDASGQGNNGTLSGFSITTPKYGDANNTGWVIDSDWQAGKYGNALKFGGANGFFQTNNSVTSTSAFSYSLWFKSGKGSYSANQYLFSQGDDDPSAYIGTNGKLNVMTDNALKITSSKTVLDTNWHHVQVTADGSNLKLYLDGGFEGSIGYTGSSEDAGFTAGADIYRNNFFNGYIDDVKIYNYARTPDEIRLDYNAGFAALFGPQTGCDQDPGSCMTQGLVGYWPMEEGSGNIAYDASNYAYNATTSGTAPGWTKGKVGSVLSFDGTDDLIQTSATVLFNTNNVYTAEAWIYPTTSGDPLTFLSFGSSASGNQYVDEFSLRNLALRFANYAGAWSGSAGTLSLNTWNHAVLIHDGANDNVKIYLNGVLGVDASYTTDLLTTTGAITAGALNTVTPGEYFAGRVDEVRIYNRALSAAEVRYHYNKGGPVAQWKFDEGEGTTAYDSTDNNNDGTLTSGPAWVAGKYGSALSFDGVNDYVSVADNNSLDITSAITISAWINPTKTGANRQVIVSKRVAQTNSSNYQFYIFGGEAGKVNFYNGVAEYEFNYAPPSNTWTHLVMTLDGTTGKLYANGALKDTKIFSFGAANAAPLTIGYFDHSTTDEIFSGFIDDVRIYNYVRTTEQIRQDYNAGLSTHFK